MILDARSGIRGLLTNKDTGQPIRKVIYANLDTGEYEAYKVNAEGQIIHPKTTYKGKARLHFQPTVNLVKKPAYVDYDFAERNQSPKTRTVTRPIHIPLFDRKCEHKGCTRFANWSTSDEVDLLPVKQGRLFFSQARVVGVHWWCDFHYKAPRLLDGKGEEIERFDDAGGVRPQWHS